MMKANKIKKGLRVKCPFGKEGTVKSYDKAGRWGAKPPRKAKIETDGGEVFEEYITNLQIVEVKS